MHNTSVENFKKMCICTIDSCYLQNIKCIEFSFTGPTTAIDICRYVVLRHNNLLCSPHYNRKRINILCNLKQELCEYNVLDDLKQLHATSNATCDYFTRKTTFDDIFECFVFTLPIRISHRWISVGKWFLRCSGHFEDCSNPFQALKLSFKGEKDSNRIEVWIHVGELRLFPVTPHDLFVDSNKFCNFMEDPLAVLHFPSNSSQRFFYLPKLTPGTLISISRDLPLSSPFKSYFDLRTYWQQQYGYNLPENPKGIVYFNVAFTNDGTVYTYPSCCVLSKQPQLLSISENLPSVIGNMLWQDIKPIILGFPVNTTLEPCFSRNLRIPWKDKLAADLEKAKEMDKWIDLDELDTCYSKYFPRNKVPNAKKDQKHVSKKKKLGTNQPRRSGTQKNAYNKITKYFPSQKSNVAIRRTVNKTMFKPTNDIRERDSNDRSCKSIGND